MYTLLNFYDTPTTLDDFLERETSEFHTSDDDIEIRQADCGFCLIPFGCAPVYIGESLNGESTALYLDKDATIDNHRICLGVGESCDDDYAFVDHLYTAEEIINSLERADGEPFRGLFFDCILGAIVQASRHNVFNNLSDIIQYLRRNEQYPYGPLSPNDMSAIENRSHIVASRVHVVKWLN